jgi:two-component system sensor histidine kinase QseC
MMPSPHNSQDAAVSKKIKPAYSLRRRLWLATIVVNMCFFAVAVVAVVGTSWHITDRMMRESLQEAGMLILVASRDFHERGMMPDRFNESDLPPPLPNVRINQNRIAYQIVHNDQVVARTITAPKEPFVEHFTRDRGFVTVSRNNRDWRVFVVKSRNANFEVQVGRPLAPYVRFLTRIGKQLLVPAIILLALFGGISLLITRRLMRPINEVTANVTQKSSEDLTPVDVQRLPAELVPLVASLNGMLARLEHSLEAERRFTADAAHELRTPLAALSMKAQLLKRQHPEAADAFTALSADIARCTSLIEQLLLLARLDPMNTDPNVPLQEISLSQYTDEWLAPHLAAAKARNISLTRRVATSDARIRINPELIGTALHNLIANAIKYSNEGCRVELQSRVDGNTLVITVADDGPGVPPEHLDKLTHRFYRVLGTGKTGSGLGLSIVARIAEIHHGTINFGQGLDGKGFAVTLTLPLVATNSEGGLRNEECGIRNSEVGIRNSEFGIRNSEFY